MTENKKELEEGAILLWKKNVDAGSKKPHFTGIAKINGADVEISLWPTKLDYMFSGKIGAPFRKEEDVGF